VSQQYLSEVGQGGGGGGGGGKGGGGGRGAGIKGGGRRTGGEKRDSQLGVKWKKMQCCAIFGN